MKLKLNATNIIIAINIVIFMFAFLSGSTTKFILLLGLNSPVNYGFFATITSAFMHTTLLHLGFNMLVLHMIGGALEGFLGVRNYIAYYLLTAVIGGVLTTIFDSTITVGASGVIYAMITTLIVMDKYGSGSIRVANSNSLLMLLGINLVFSLIAPNVSLIGHVSGIVAGIIAGVIIMNVEERGKLR